MVRECSCEALAAVDHYLLDLLDAAGHRGELNEAGLGRFGNDLGQRGLAHARRTPEDHRAGIVALDLHAQRLSGADQMLLAEQFVQAARPHPLRQRRPSGVACRPLEERCGTSGSMSKRLIGALAPLLRCSAARCSARCRDASYNSTLAATAAFKLSTGPGQGIVIVPSALRAISSGTPLPSLPMTSATGAARSARSADFVALELVANALHARLAQSGKTVPLRSPRAAALGKRSPPRRAPPSHSTRSQFPANSPRLSRRMPLPSAESCPDFRDPECPPAQRTSAFLLVLAENMRPRPIRRLNKRGNRLRRFGRQRLVEQLLRQFENLHIPALPGAYPATAQILDLGTLRNKDRFHAQTRAQRFREQIRPFDTREAAGAACERLPARGPAHSAPSAAPSGAHYLCFPPRGPASNPSLLCRF
jgi:hypothetical protein